MIHLFGDSHISIIDNKNITKHIMKAGSAMGLDNTDSILNYHYVIKKKLIEIKDEPIIFKFGQVDVEFVYYLKLVRNPSLNFNDFAILSVNHYFNFIKKNLKGMQLSIMSIYPPCVNDKYIKSALLNPLPNNIKDDFSQKIENIVIPSLKQRTMYSIFYNELLKKKSEQYKIPFIDIFKPIFDKHYKFINNDSNHHISNKEAIDIINSIIDMKNF